uniref:NADH-ubiquinone oxidoreductase chain 2 n=1 Tax=Branchinecta paludosa TaxID=111186 RepID=A0A8K1I8D8_9CRUS|nr:NADH dehydrogenase subunit 2 [Branchinecta paludosa]
MMKWFILITSYALVLSSSSWMGLWLALELNTLSFTPILVKTDKEVSIKYFLVQSLGSVLFLSGILHPIMENCIIVGLLLKIGVAPLHLWIPSLSKFMQWSTLLFLLTLQKLGPLWGILMLNYTSTNVITLSALIGSIGGITQSNIRLLLAYSSITHLAWIFLCLSSASMVFSYFLIYCSMNLLLIFMLYFLELSSISQMWKPISFSSKMALISSLLSMGGLPPLLGFMIKWMALESQMASIMLVFVLILSSCFSLFFYIKIIMIPLLSHSSLPQSTSFPWVVVSIQWGLPFLLI